MNNNQQIAMDNISADNIRMLITTTMDMYNLQFLTDYRISTGFNCWKSKVFFYVLVIGSLSDYSFKVFFFFGFEFVLKCKNIPKQIDYK